MDDNKEDQADRSEARMEFRYFKSAFFRVIHADGAWGGVTPRGDIHMVLYNERPSIPDRAFHGIETGGYIGDEVLMEANEGMVREVEADIILSYPTAKAILVWLQDKVDVIERALQDARQKAAQQKAAQHTSEEVVSNDNH